MPLPLLISNLVNIRYLTGLDMTAGVLLMSPRKRVLFVDDRYLEKAKKGAKTAKEMKVLHIKELTEYVKRYKRVQFEADDLTVSRLNRWKKRFRGVTLVSSQGVIEEMRRQKKPKELKAMAKACRITDRVLRVVPKLLKPGITEANLAWEIETLSHNLGAEDMAFETIVAFADHTSRPHHEPTRKRLRKGDIVQIDMGVKVDGYCSDCSRVFFTGKPTGEQKKVHDLLVATVKECTKRAKVGATNHALDTLARKLLKEKGYDEYFIHGLGHGVGLEIHEGVSLGQRALKQILKSNEVITIEPGVYIEGKWGMRVEDTVAVSKIGGKRLTKVKF